VYHKLLHSWNSFEKIIIDNIGSRGGDKARPAWALARARPKIFGILGVSLGQNWIFLGINLGQN
jgi:hypothetical protein